MQRDAGITLAELRVDGGAAANDLLMQFQADLLGVPVVRPKVLETTALGAAYLAGLAVGFWRDAAEVAALAGGPRFEPAMTRDRGAAAGGLAEGGRAREGLELRHIAPGRLPRRHGRTLHARGEHRTESVEHLPHRRRLVGKHLRVVEIVDDASVVDLEDEQPAVG